MFSNRPSAPTNKLADQAAQSADQAIKATQRAANGALDDLAVSVEGMRQDAAPMLNRVGEQAQALAQSGIDAVRDGTQMLRERAQHASDSTTRYIRDEPVKAMLIAAATGATLMALLGLMRHSRHSRDRG